MGLMKLNKEPHYVPSLAIRVLCQHPVKYGGTRASNQTVRSGGDKFPWGREVAAFKYQQLLPAV